MQLQMNTNFIGKKTTLAVEYFFENKEKFIGRARLWIDSLFLGSLGDTIIFDGYLIGGLTEILNKESLDKRYLLNNQYATYDKLEKDILNFNDDPYELAEKFTVNLGTWSDYFNIYSYKLTDELGVILWKYVDAENSLEDLTDYPKDILYAEFKYHDLVQIINELNQLKPFDVYKESRKLAAILEAKGLHQYHGTIIDAIEDSSTATEILMKLQFILKSINNSILDESDKELIEETLSHIHHSL
ncbi:hypothetical protein [Providencia stuartii]|uniref:hypothetical protein n=1 Tax=Providencia stuartii TaxID=588 RepID=UPI003D7F5050